MNELKGTMLGVGGKEKRKNHLPKTYMFLHSAANHWRSDRRLSAYDCRIYRLQHSSPILARRFSSASSFWLASSMAL